MSKQDQSSRRRFLQQIGATSILAAVSPFNSLSAMEKAEERTLFYERKISVGDKIRLGVIGFGVQGHFDLGTALKVPGVELVAGCDLYDGRMERLKELHGNNIFTTRDYREILERKDVDAVIIATPVFLHPEHFEAAVKSGKHIYIEKPASLDVEGCKRVMKAADGADRKLNITFGFQRRSGIVYQKAKQLADSGAIGAREARSAPAASATSSAEPSHRAKSSTSS